MEIGNQHIYFIILLRNCENNGKDNVCQNTILLHYNLENKKIVFNYSVFNNPPNFLFGFYTVQ